MRDLCRLDFDNPDSKCEKTKLEVEKIGFGFGSPKRKLAKADLEKKKEAKQQLITATKRCIQDGICEDLHIIGLRWDKCSVCDDHLPKLIKEVIQPLKSANIPVHYEEINAQSEVGKDLFVTGGCQGTPCILVKHPSGEYKKAYDGSQETVGAMSNILGIDNPFFYGNASEKRPKNILKKNSDNITINNSRSMWL